MSALQRTDSPVGEIIHSRRSRQGPPGASYQERLTFLLLNWLQEDLQSTPESRTRIFADASTEPTVLEIDILPASSPRVQTLNEASLHRVKLGIMVKKVSDPSTETRYKYHLSAIALSLDAAEQRLHSAERVESSRMDIMWHDMSFSDALDFLRTWSKVRYNWFGERRSIQESDTVLAEIREHNAAHHQAT
jgi:hypothetical protein